MKGKWIALIPAYKPDTLLIDLLHKLQDADFVTIVVDDGSGREYKDIFQQAASMAQVLTHSENQGKGRALKTGMEYIRTHYCGDYITITMDADGQHTVSDARKLCQTVQKAPNTLILGSRLLEGNIPLRSRLGNTITRAVYRFATGLYIYDTQTGLRAFSSRLLPGLLSIPGERYEYEMSMLLECSRQDIPLREVPIQTIYLNRNKGSHFHAWRDSLRIYREIFRYMGTRAGQVEQAQTAAPSVPPLLEGRSEPLA